MRPQRKHTGVDIQRTLNRIVNAAAKGRGLVLQADEVERVALALLAAEQLSQEKDDGRSN